MARLGTLFTTLVVAVVLAVVATAVLLAGCQGDSSNDAAGSFTPIEPDTLTVATTFPSAGFWEGSSVDDITGGFEYELAMDLASRFGLEHIEVVSVPFDDLVQGRATGFDLALAQVSVTEQRERDVELSDTYLTTPVGVVGRAGEEVRDLAAARDLHWGVGIATTEVEVLQGQIRPHEAPQVYATTTEAIQHVVSGDVDVVAADFIRAVAEVAADHEELALVAQIEAPQYYAALLPKGSSNLEAVNSAIRALRTDGTLHRLRDELYSYFQVDPESIPTIQVRS